MDEAINQRLQQLQGAILEPAKTWAQIAGTTKPNVTKANPSAYAKQQQVEKVRRERAQYEVTLTAHTATEQIKSKLITTDAKEITQLCQFAIDSTTTIGDMKPRLRGIDKLKNNSIRLQCKSAEEVQLLQKVDWNKAFDGLTIYKPKYGIVIHGVPTEELDITDEEGNIARLQSCNDKICIVKVTPLRRKTSQSKPAAHQSIVVFTEDPHAADQCIKMGFFISYQSYPAERYAPQLRITQCFKCGGYGHRATHCKRKQKCGKCGTEEHNTNICTETRRHCSNCQGDHEAWYYECPARISESHRLAELRISTSPYFTS